MFSKPHTQTATLKSNLNRIKFDERASIEKMTDELAKAANNPYAASLPLMASATLGDNARYDRTLQIMMDQLEALEVSPKKIDSWMHSNDFKAWMWGRILLAANSINDDDTVKKAKAIYWYCIPTV